MKSHFRYNKTDKNEIIYFLKNPLLTGNFLKKDNSVKWLQKSILHKIKTHLENLSFIRENDFEDDWKRRFFHSGSKFDVWSFVRSRLALLDTELLIYSDRLLPLPALLNCCCCLGFVFHFCASETSFLAQVLNKR